MTAQSSQLRAGQTTHLTEDRRRVTIWDKAPDAGTYWAHLTDDPNRPLVLVKVRKEQGSPLPVVTLIETWSNR